MVLLMVALNADGVGEVEAYLVLFITNVKGWARVREACVWGRVVVGRLVTLGDHCGRRD